jgi:hypothetical protein
MFDLLRNFLVLTIFLAATGFVLSEMLLAVVLPLLSVRALVFALSALICWLLLDNVTLAQDLFHATASTSTDGERHLLRSLMFANEKFRLAHAQLEEEIASHRATALQLDVLSERMKKARRVLIRSSSDNWGLLAFKCIVTSNLVQMKKPRRGLIRSSSDSWTANSNVELTKKSHRVQRRNSSFQ